MKNNINTEETKLRPFDIVKVKKHETWHYGMITETSGYDASVVWFEKETDLHAAWWEESELTVVNNAAAIIANEMAHPFGGNKEQGDLLVGIKNDTRVQYARNQGQTHLRLMQRTRQNAHAIRRRAAKSTRNSRKSIGKPLKTQKLWQNSTKRNLQKRATA